MDDLTPYEEVNLHLRRDLLKLLVERASMLMEVDTFPPSSAQLLLPVIRKASETAKTGDLEQCRVMTNELNAQLDQIAPEFFRTFAE